MELPSGTITFLLTDVEGSTGLWERHPGVMNAALARHEALGLAAVERHRGCVIRTKGEGDSMFAVFDRASDAVAAACAFQRALAIEPWPAPVSLKVRMALHTGEANLRDGDYYGTAVNRCARLRAVAHGGQVVLSGATEALVRGELPEGASVRSLGEHRLRDLEYPERVFQLLHPDLPSQFSRLLSLDALPNNLPQQLTSFIGRESEIEDVTSLLGRARLMTVTGPGGSGKTRLALQVAAEVLDVYAEGVWWVELGDVTDPRFVARAVANVLGLREAPDTPLRQALADYLRSRRVLLVLDNCEHLLDACAALAQDLLMACPRLTVLATSREVLGVPGEIVYRVPLLSLPDPDHLPSLPSLGQFEAVQLFVERAAAQRPGFAVTSQNAFFVAKVCQRLDGIPLALELAAARMRAMPVQEIAERLDGQSGFLTGGRTASPRQQTLTAMVDWSYDLLTNEERVLLHRLSIFRGAWSLAGVESICADDARPAAAAAGVARARVVDLLTSLVDKSLVLYEEAGDGKGQYRILETIREYAYERLLAGGESEERLERHAAWYLSELRRHGRERLERPVACEGEWERRWLAAVRRDYTNVQAAIERSLGRGQMARVVEFIELLFPFWMKAGYITEGRHLYARLLDAFRTERETGAAGDAARAGVIAGVIVNAGQLAQVQGDLLSGRSLFEEALAMCEASGEARYYHESLVNLGFLELGDRNFAAARRYFESSQKGHDGDWADLRALLGLGVVARFEGRYRDACEAFSAVLEGVQSWVYPDLGLVAHALLNMGHAFRRLGEPDVAAAHYRDALDTFVSRVEHGGIGYCLDGFAALAAEEAERREAREAAPLARVSERTEALAGRALRLFAAADELRRTQEIVLAPVDRDERDDLVRRCEHLLGVREANAAWEEGRELPLERAISVALESGKGLK